MFTVNGPPQALTFKMKFLFCLHASLDLAPQLLSEISFYIPTFSDRSRFRASRSSSSIFARSFFLGKRLSADSRSLLAQCAPSTLSKKSSASTRAFFRADFHAKTRFDRSVLFLVSSKKFAKLFLGCLGSAPRYRSVARRSVVVARARAPRRLSVVSLFRAAARALARDSSALDL